MPRKPKAKDGLTAGERVALYEAERAQRRARDVGAATNGADDPNAATESDKNAASLPKTEKIEPKILPKPQHATVRVDFSAEQGYIKPMHAMCNGPVSYGADISELFRQIGVPSVRLAGTDTAVSSLAVDISRIFKNMDADPRDPRNYDFTVTDKYVRAANDCTRAVIALAQAEHDP